MEKVTKQMSATDRTAAIRRAAEIIQNKHREAPIAESCRAALIRQMHTPPTEGHVPAMEKFEVGKRFESDVLIAIKKGKEREGHRSRRIIRGSLPGDAERVCKDTLRHRGSMWETAICSERLENSHHGPHIQKMGPCKTG